MNHISQFERLVEEIAVNKYQTMINLFHFTSYVIPSVAKNSFFCFVIFLQKKIFYLQEKQKSVFFLFEIRKMIIYLKIRQIDQITEKFQLNSLFPYV